MKFGTCAVVLVIAAALQSSSAAHLRLHNGPDIATKHHTVVAAKNVSGASCLHRGTAINVAARRSDASRAGQTSKLRVCNAVTTEREGIINVWHNGKELTIEALASRKCIEFVIPISAKNKFVVKLTGQVSADWSEEKSQSDMVDIPILFLVASVFGQGDSTTFTVDEFHGESSDLNSVQVAYMDVRRGAPDAKLQLISPGGEFEMSGGTFMTVCAGEYSLRFLQDGKTAQEVSTTASFDVGEQYVILRVAPKSSQDDGSGLGETAVVYPQSSNSWFHALLR